MNLSGWGRFPQVDSRVLRPRTPEAVADALAGGRAIPRGNGRAYGDAAVSHGVTLDLRGLDRMLAFDPATGQLVAEAGVLLSDIIDAFLPRGWFPLVTPGTRFVTLGGMIAADVHGKNHHRAGSMAESVDWVEVMVAPGQVRRAARDENPELFEMTCGGMGLTGPILRAAIRLQRVDSGWIRQDSIAAPDLDAALAAFEARMAATYSVAWIDCLASGRSLGRSIVMTGEHARLAELDNRRRLRPFAIPAKRRLSVPFDLPGLALNRWTVGAFNAAYWRQGRRGAGPRLVDWQSYFYPLDAIDGWNRIYGRRGFAQWQVALPLDRAAVGLRALLAEIAAAGQGSFLAVLKRFGPGRGGLSFPVEGYTLALDFPATPAALALMDRLDALALAQGGRFYLAKDARMTAATFARAEPRLPGFQRFRSAAGLDLRFASAQSERLNL
ncbi:FAD-binding oxidoreductase [Frigidibacter oleivorans]|uniref:FAD-binding oxidoreductase n=1 Tax=Frigidibacter oleivorans TaxID=2487129 RepID=UPI000F8E5D89|nr:FAD-binding oxidoreductase [Frigidibacter oleivorans]